MNPENLKNNRKFLENYQQTVAGPSTFSKMEFFGQSSTPSCITRGEGAYTWDVDGNRYIDYMIGQGAVTLGHNHLKVQEALTEQLRYGTSFSLPSKWEVLVAEMLIDMIPSAEMVRFGKNGNDVTSAAVRLSRYISGKNHILFCGYHGWQDWYIGQTSMNGGVPEPVRELSHRFNYDDLESLQTLIERYDGDIACIILDPSPAKFEKPATKFLTEVRKLADSKGILLIFDEVVTGFRFNNGGIQGLTGVIPDLSAFSKAIANGLPLSALVGKKDVMNRFNEIFFSLTYAGETLSLAAATAVLKVYKEVKVPEHLFRMGKLLKEGLKDLIRENGLDERISIYGADCKFGLSFLNQEQPNYDSNNDILRWTEECCREGILSSGAHFISLAHTREVIYETLERYSRVFPRIRKTLLGL